MSIAALILAAGSSSRMGRPKALLEYRGKTFLENIINTARAAAADHVIVAISRSDDKIKNTIDLAGIDLVENSELETAGPLGSIRAGISKLINQTVDYAIVWPVDQPHVRLETIQALQSAFKRTRAPVIVPEFNGRRGHPVLFSPAIFGELMEAPDDQGARFVVRRVPERVVHVTVNDPAVVEDIDTPEDYARLISSTKSLL